MPRDGDRCKPATQHLEIDGATGRPPGEYTAPMWQPPPALLTLCRSHLGHEPTEVVRFRRANDSLHASIRVRVGANTFIATHRSDPRRGGMEAIVLAAMYRGGAPVPRPIAYGEGWLLQEDLGTTTLARALNAPGAPVG
ncbi:MAG: hypothetical protein JRI25_06890, partial [Deltaproteobacteria bacterium]|nr:hypothetical protein [Deltaproteobacteria bacterium]